MSIRKLLNIKEQVRQIRANNQDALKKLERDTAREKRERQEVDARLHAIEVELDVMSRGNRGR